MKNTKKHLRFLTALIAGFLVACGSSKNVRSAAQQAAITNALKNKEYTMQLEVMEPLQTNAVMQVASQLYMNTGNTANRVDIKNQGYTLTIKKDSVFTYLPYVGERQMGGGYNNDGGITLKTNMLDYKQESKIDKNQISISFRATNKAESFNVQITVYDFNFTRVNIFSSQRNNIVYTGFLDPVATGLKTEDN